MILHERNMKQEKKWICSLEEEFVEQQGNTWSDDKPS